MPTAAGGVLGGGPLGILVPPGVAGEAFTILVVADIGLGGLGFGDLLGLLAYPYRIPLGDLLGALGTLALTAQLLGGGGGGGVLLHSDTAA